MSTITAEMPPLNLTLIVAATSKNLGIGRNGGLPWRLKAEMQYFARVTTRLPSEYTSRSKNEVQNAVIMGRKTWESIPKKFRPLKDRLNVVLSSGATEDSKELVDGAMWVRSLEDAVKVLEKLRGDQGNAAETGLPTVARAFIIGGAGVYKSALALPDAIADRVLLTKVHSDFECDTFFPVALDSAEGSEQGWRRTGNKELSEYVGEDIPEDTIKEGDTEFEYCLFQRSSTNK